MPLPPSRAKNRQFVLKGLAKRQMSMYKPRKFPRLNRDHGSLNGLSKAVLPRQVEYSNGCTEKKNKPVEARYAPFC